MGADPWFWPSEPWVGGAAVLTGESDGDLSFLLFDSLKKGFIMRNNYKKWRYAG
jgi:hypothetical protein